MKLHTILAAALIFAPTALAQDARQFVLVGSLADGTRIFCPGRVDGAEARLPLDQGAACFLDKSGVKVEAPLAIVPPADLTKPMPVGGKRCR